MKKKILVLVMAMTLIFAYTLPVAAAETDAVVPEVPAVENIVESVAPGANADDAVVPNGAEPGTVSEDSAVQAAYDAYFEVTEALNVNEYGPMKDALDKYNQITEAFTDAQSDEWNDIVYGSVGVEVALGNLNDANLIIYAMEQKDTFTSNSNAKTAADFVSAYDACKDSGISIELFDPDIAAAYETAKTDYMPEDNAMKVYDAYVKLTEALDVLASGFYDEDFVAACESFEAVLDTFNELTDEEMTDLAWLMGAADAEEVYSIVLTDWINANLALELGALCDAYLNNLTVKTATEFVEAYEEILNDTQMLTDEDKAVILPAFEAAYEDAKTLLADNASDDEQAAGTSGSDKSDKDTSPETGDDFNAAPYAALMVIAAGVAAAALKRKRVQ